MPGTKTTTAKLTCLLSLAAAFCSAATPDYFPLQPGNSWVYRVTQGRLSRPAAVNVGEAVSLGGKTYYRVQFFERDVLVRQDDSGSLLQYDTETKSESVWLPLGAPDKQNVPISFDACSRAGWVENRNATVKTELGEFNNALELRFVNNCADAGTTVQYFVPYVGLVQYESTSIAGPVKHDLTYSRTGITNVEAQTNSFTFATDLPVYAQGQTTEAVARLSLKASQQLTLTFPSGQSTDLRITNAKGESVYFWSADKIFTAIFRAAEPVGPGEKTWVMSFPVGQLPAGKYIAEAWLTTQPRQYSGTVSFEVK